MAGKTAISLFTGGMGLDLGFERCGFDIRVAVESDRFAIETIAANRPTLPVIDRDIASVSTEDILYTAGLRPGDLDLVIGAPPCEPFSTAGRRNGFLDSRASAVHHFIAVIKEARPRFFVMEEVPGFTRAAKRHISFYERISARPQELDPDLRLGSAFDDIMTEFTGTGYKLSSGILNAADYGTPQKRRRFILIGSRDGPAVPLPQPTHTSQIPSKNHGQAQKPWITLKEALDGLDDPEPEHTEFPLKWRGFLESIPEGGCWRNLPKELHQEALGGAYDDPDNPRTRGKKGGRTGFLRRLSWDKPSPTLVDRPTTKAGCLCHPTELRPLSIREYARLQGFPDEWKFCGPVQARYRLIGQATPVPLAEAVAKEIQQALQDHPA